MARQAQIYADYDLGLERVRRIITPLSRGHVFRSPGISPTTWRNLRNLCNLRISIFFKCCSKRPFPIHSQSVSCLHLRKSAVKVFLSSMLIRVNACACAVTLSLLRSSAVGVACFAVYSASIRGSLNELVSFKLAELLVFFPGVGV